MEGSQPLEDLPGKSHVGPHRGLARGEGAPASVRNARGAVPFRDPVPAALRKDRDDLAADRADPAPRCAGPGRDHPGDPVGLDQDVVVAEEDDLAPRLGERAVCARGRGPAGARARGGGRAAPARTPRPRRPCRPGNCCRSRAPRSPRRESPCRAIPASVWRSSSARLYVGMATVTRITGRGGRPTGGAPPRPSRLAGRRRGSAGGAGPAPARGRPARKTVRCRIARSGR